MKITVPIEPDNPTNHTGLQKLRDLLLIPISISNPDIQYSLFIMRCPEHNVVGYRVENASLALLEQLIQQLAETLNPVEECRKCLRRDNAVDELQEDREGSTPAIPAASLFMSARSKLRQSDKLSRDSASLHRWILLKNSILQSATFHSAPPKAEVDSQETHGLGCDDDKEACDEVDEDAFMFPDPHAFVAPSLDCDVSEKQWLDSLLEDLSDNDDDVGAANPEVRRDDYLSSPLCLPVSPLTTES